MVNVLVLSVFAIVNVKKSGGGVGGAGGAGGAGGGRGAGGSGGCC